MRHVTGENAAHITPRQIVAYLTGAAQDVICRKRRGQSRRGSTSRQR